MMTKAAPAICLIHWTFPPTTGGVESHLADVARLLTEAGCEVTVVTGESVPQAQGGYDIVSTKLLHLERLRSQTAADADELERLFYEIITQRHIQVVHGHNLHHFSPVPALVLEKLRLQLGFWMHHTFHETWPDVLQEQPVYRGWHGNYAVSRFVQQQCYDRLGFRPRLFHLGIDLDRFRSTQPCFSSGRIPVLLHPARLLPWKGVHLSVQLLARLHQQGLAARLIVTDTQRIADWNDELNTYREHIHSLITQLNLHDAVEFRSPTYSQMSSLYNEADLVLYPTVGEEPYGLVPLEAMACERPIVASISGGIPETVLDGQTGYIVKPGDLDAMTKCVAHILTQPALAQQIGSAGRSHVERNFDGREYMRKLLGYYLN